MIIFLMTMAILSQKASGQCLTTYRMFNCSGAGLKTIPNTPDHISTGIFSYNEIEIVTSDSLAKFVSLDLSHNYIRALNSGSNLLLELILSDNPLRFFYFNSSSLTVLDLSSCAINYFNEELFNALPALKVLRISDNPLKSLGPQITFLTPLQSLSVSNTLIQYLPTFPFLMSLDISQNKNLVTFPTQPNLRTLKASDSALLLVQLNPLLKYADLSKNQIPSLTVYEDLEFLNASWNLLRTFQVDNVMLRNVDLSNNLLSSFDVVSRFVLTLNLSNNPINELRVHCIDCTVDCSYCRVKATDLLNVKSLDLSWNNLETADVFGAKHIDLRHNFLSSVSTNAETFDLRHNYLKDPDNLRLEGIGLLSENQWPCDCTVQMNLLKYSMDARICGDKPVTSRNCLGRRAVSESWVTLTLAATAILAFIVILYSYKKRIEREDTRQVTEACFEINDLPSYEEALEMAKPDWRTNRHNARRNRRRE